MNIAKRFTPKISFILPDLAAFTVLDVLHLRSYSTKKRIRCFPKRPGSWSLWLQYKNMVQLFRPEDLK